MVYPTHKEFVLALRERMDRPFNFIVPKMKPKEHKVIDICCTVDGRCQWVRFLLKLDDQQVEFIANAFK